MYQGIIYYIIYTITGLIYVLYIRSLLSTTYMLVSPNHVQESINQINQGIQQLFGGLTKHFIVQINETGYFYTHTSEEHLSDLSISLLSRESLNPRRALEK